MERLTPGGGNSRLPQYIVPTQIQKKRILEPLEGGLDLGITGILTFLGHSGQTGHSSWKLEKPKGILNWVFAGNSSS